MMKKWILILILGTSCSSPEYTYTCDLTFRHLDLADTIRHDLTGNNYHHLGHALERGSKDCLSLFESQRDDECVVPKEGLKAKVVFALKNGDPEEDLEVLLLEDTVACNMD